MEAMADLAREPKMGGVITLYDIDAVAAEHNKIIGNAISARPEAGGKWGVQDGPPLKGPSRAPTSSSPPSCREPSGRWRPTSTCPSGTASTKAWGDTAGPGGLVRALRTIPMYVEIAEAVAAYAPNAWVINYTNPMTLCNETLYRVFPGIKAFGCCHEVFGTQEVLKGIYELATGDTGVTAETSTSTWWASITSPGLPQPPAAGWISSRSIRLMRRSITT